MKKSPIQLYREHREMKRWLKHLVAANKVCIKAIDDAMLKMPNSEERGKRVALATGALELANDQARHFGLGEKL